MAGYMLGEGLNLDHGYYGTIRSITNVRDIAIIITDRAILRAKPSPYTGFAIELIASF